MNKYRHLAKEAQQQRRKEKMCLGKKVFETEAAAYQKGQKSYRCTYCGKWHRSGQFGRFVAHLRTPLRGDERWAAIQFEKTYSK